MSINQSNEGEFRNFWQLVFNQSRANGAEYFGDRLPCHSWNWPKNTYLQRRLSELRKQRSDDFADVEPKNRKPLSLLNRRRLSVYHERTNWLRQAGPSVEEH